MSENRTTDPRVVRTRNALSGAFIALIHEKPFDLITVKDILERAHVSRSTFYAHYHHPTDLLLSDAEDFLARLANADVSPRVAPVHELFAHVADMRQMYDALVESGHIHELLDIARGCFARAFERRWPSAIAYAYAGALISLLTWWLERGAEEMPVQMDEIFHQMISTRHS